MKKYVLGAVAIAAALTLASCSSQAPTEEAAAPASPSAAAPVETEAAPVETEAAEPSMEPKDCWDIPVPEGSFYLTKEDTLSDGSVMCQLWARGSQLEAGKAWFDTLIAEGWTDWGGNKDSDGNPSQAAYLGKSQALYQAADGDGADAWTLYTYMPRD